MTISPRAGRMRVHAPQKIVRELGGRGLLERVNARALRIHAAEDVLDRSVLAGGIEPLEDDQQRVRVAGVE